MRKFLGLVALASTFFTSQAVEAAIVTQWNFNGGSATTVPGGNSSPTTALGSGTASLVGATSGSFASGVANGGSTDPITTAPPNYGWGITNFAAQGTNNLGTGVQFNVSTVGWQDISVSWDQRHSNSSARHVQFQYSTDGSTWTSFAPLFEASNGDTWFNNRSVDLTSITAVNDNANFGFRIVSAFDPATNTGYVSSSSTSSYASTGTWRFDMVTVNATAIPEPGSMAVLGVVGLAGVAVRRFRNKQSDSATDTAAV